MSTLRIVSVVVAVMGAGAAFAFGPGPVALASTCPGYVSGPATCTVSVKFVGSTTYGSAYGLPSFSLSGLNGGIPVNDPALTFTASDSSNQRPLITGQLVCSTSAEPTTKTTNSVGVYHDLSNCAAGSTLSDLDPGYAIVYDTAHSSYTITKANLSIVVAPGQPFSYTDPLGLKWNEDSGWMPCPSSTAYSVSKSVSATWAAGQVTLRFSSDVANFPAVGRVPFQKSYVTVAGMKPVKYDGTFPVTGAAIRYVQYALAKYPGKETLDGTATFTPATTSCAAYGSERLVVGINQSVAAISGNPNPVVVLMSTLATPPICTATNGAISHDSDWSITNAAGTGLTNITCSGAADPNYTITYPAQNTPLALGGGQHQSLFVTKANTRVYNGATSASRSKAFSAPQVLDSDYGTFGSPLFFISPSAEATYTNGIPATGVKLRCTLGKTSSYHVTVTTAKTSGLGGATCLFTKAQMSHFPASSSQPLLVSSRGSAGYAAAAGCEGTDVSESENNTGARCSTPPTVRIKS